MTQDKSREELLTLIQEGLDDVANGRTQPFVEAMADIRKELILDKQDQ